jgi:hypothetical protein
MSTPIDVWDTGTFDPELMAMLSANQQLVRDYLSTDRRQFEEREARRSLDAARFQPLQQRLPDVR